MASSRPTFETQWFNCVTSTQEVLKDLFQKGASEGALVAAREQTHGRGRRNHFWASPADLGLWVSVIVMPGGPETSWTWAPLWAGVVVWQALKKMLSVLPTCDPEQIQLKWINDLMVGDKKLGGILTERVEDSRGRRGVILGIGINLQQQQEDFPEGLRDHAISLIQCIGKPISAQVALTALTASLENYYPLLNPLRPNLIKELWENHAEGLDGLWRIHQGDQILEGRFLGLGEAGEMRLLTAEKGEKLIIQADKSEWVREA